MNYLFLGAFKNVLRHKKSYIFFSLQVLVSFVMMLVFGSLASSLRVGIDEMENDNTAHSIYLHEVRSKGDKSDGMQYYNSSPMVYDDYLWIKEKYNDILSTSFALRSNIYAVKNGHPYIFNILFVTDEYFYNCYENAEMLDFSKQKVILAPEGVEQMSNYDNSSYSINYKLQDFLALAKIDGYTIKPIQSAYNGKVDRINIFTTTWYENKEQDTAPLSNVMIVPIELYFKYFTESDEYYNTMLSINFYDKTNTEVLTKICEALVEEKDTAGECIYASPISVFEEYASNQIQLARLLQILSVAAIIITGIGFIGLILVIFDNRKKKLAVALVTGATYSSLYLEIILEIETVILFGVVSGELLEIVGLNILNKQIPVFELVTDINLAVLLPIFYVTMGMLISLAALYNLFKLEPNEILKKE